MLSQGPGLQEPVRCQGAFGGGVTPETPLREPRPSTLSPGQEVGGGGEGAPGEEEHGRWGFIRGLGGALISSSQNVLFQKWNHTKYSQLRPSLIVRHEKMSSKFRFVAAVEQRCNQAFCFG